MNLGEIINPCGELVNGEWVPCETTAIVQQKSGSQQQGLANLGEIINPCGELVNGEWVPCETTATVQQKSGSQQQDVDGLGGIGAMLSIVLFVIIGIIYFFDIPLKNFLKKG